MKRANYCTHQTERAARGQHGISLCRPAPLVMHALGKPRKLSNLMMDQVYWLDPLNRLRLLEAILGIFADGSRVAIEGDAHVLANLELVRLAGAVYGPVEPFKREQGAESAVVIVPLESEEDVRHVLEVLMSGSELVPGVEAIQVEHGGSVQFLVGDGFDRECVSVGPLVPVQLLRNLVRMAVIGGFYTRAQAMEHFGQSNGI